MNRTDLIKECLNAVEARSYLEVGVSKGQTFLDIRCDRKVAVDPKFRFDWKAIEGSDQSAVFHEKTSDEFFASGSSPQDMFDVIFLDGLHTVEQTLRDFTNAVSFLNEGGMIMIDDVVPDSYLSSLRDQNNTNAAKSRLGIRDKAWMGDVYRLVPFIETFFQQYSYALPEECALCLVVWKSARSAGNIVSRTLEEVGRFPFESIVLEAEFYNRKPLADILGAVASSGKSNVL